MYKCICGEKINKPDYFQVFLQESLPIIWIILNYKFESTKNYEIILNMASWNLLCGLRI